MRSDDIAISVHNLTKTYRLFGHPGDRIKQFFSLGLKQYHREFTALKNVSFDIRKGETVGIIGRNGAGKSTLLQVVCGILKPTAGSVQINGKISALLELGAGFNPEFTGRENVYFQGYLMGFSKVQMDERFDEIAAFADIGEFIDQPVRTYSSGMFVRLAFASATQSKPDILIVDEALAVGDRTFQARCFRRISSIREKGGAILIVTHALEQVAHFCDRAILLDRGRLIVSGNPATTLDLYLQRLNRSEMESTAKLTNTATVPSTEDEFPLHPGYSHRETRWGDRAVTMYRVKIIQNDRENPKILVPGEVTQVECGIHFHTDMERPLFGLSVKSMEGAILFSANSLQLLSPSDIHCQKADDRIKIIFSFRPFFDCGEYLVSIGVASDTPAGIQPHDRRYDVLKIRVAYPVSSNGDIDMGPTLRIVAPEP